MLSKFKKKLAKDDPGRFVKQHGRAVLYKIRRIDKAIEFLRYDVESRENLDEDHPDRLSAEYRLAVGYKSRGHIDEAIELLEHIAKIEEKLAVLLRAMNSLGL